MRQAQSEEGKGLAAGKSGKGEIKSPESWSWKRKLHTFEKIFV